VSIYLDVHDEATNQSLFGDELRRTDGKPGRPRQQAVFCAKCGKLDSIFLGGGVALESKRCVRCGGELSTTRARSARLRLYDAIMERNRILVMEAADGDGSIDDAVAYAEYAAHTAFRMQLVPYGPEPKR